MFRPATSANNLGESSRQVIILVGEFASHEVCAVEMARTGMVAVDTEATDAYGGPAANHSLFSLLAEKSGDDEMVLQCLHAFCKLLQAR